MFTKNGYVFIDDPSSYTPNLSSYSSFTDEGSVSYLVSNKLIVRLYEALERDCAKNHINFSSWKDNLFK